MKIEEEWVGYVLNLKINKNYNILFTFVRKRMNFTTLFTKIFEFDFVQNELISLQIKYFQSNFIKKNDFHNFNLQK